MNYLLVGDMHVRPQDIEECNKLINLIVESVSVYKVEVIVFMGDQFHTHNLVFNTILDFWEKAFIRLTKLCKVIAIKGNHDTEVGRQEHSLQWFKHIANLRIVDEPFCFDSKLFLPYIKDNNEFIEICNKYDYITTVICHADFDGAKYDNGCYIKDGIKPESIPQSKAISGHIHTHAEFGKVFYTGSPRWLTLNDANVAKFIWVFDFDKEVLKWIPTSVACKQIRKYSVRQEDTTWVDFNVGPGDDDCTIDIYGDKQFIEEKGSYYHKLGYKTRTFLTKISKTIIRESDGVVNAFNVFIDKYNPCYNTSSNRLKELVKDRITWVT